MPLDRVTPAYVSWGVFVFCSLFALVYIAWIVWEAVPRLTAGPIRFRLPLASLAKPLKPSKMGQGLIDPLSFTAAGFGFSLGFVLFFISRTPSTTTYSWFWTWFPVLLPWVVAKDLLGTGRRWFNPRREAKPWRVLASGLLSLVMGALALALGLRALQDGKNPAGQPAGPLILASAIGFVMGAAALQEYMSGTRVRERGIEAFGTFLPWWRIAVWGWHPREGGFDGILYLAIPSLRLFRVPVTPDAEVYVPVPASERPALEVFLAGHTATGGCRG
jgi:hypothetical protein